MILLGFGEFESSHNNMDMKHHAYTENTEMRKMISFARLSGRLCPNFLEVSRYDKLSPFLGWRMALRCLEYRKAAFHAGPAHPQNDATMSNSLHPEIEAHGQLTC
jgi:hypothetical protein